MQTDPHDEIRKLVSVTRQKVTIAKAFLLDEMRKAPIGEVHDVGELLDRHLIDKHLVLPKQITWLPDRKEWQPSPAEVADAISWNLATCEAIWELIHANQLMMHSSRIVEAQDFSMGCQVPGYGGHMRFDRLRPALPASVRLPLSASNRDREILTNPDLYLHRIEDSNLPRDVADSLREAVLCFRHELFTPAVVMLGKASEEMWIETGISLFQATSKDEKKIQELAGTTSIVQKLQAVLKCCERHDAAEILDRSGLKLNDVKDVAAWSDVVRDSRNLVHSRAKPALPNTYEKVACLLLGAIPRFRLLNAVISSARTHESS